MTPEKIVDSLIDPEFGSLWNEREGGEFRQAVLALLEERDRLKRKYEAQHETMMKRLERERRAFERRESEIRRVYERERRKQW